MELVSSELITTVKSFILLASAGMKIVYYLTKFKQFVVYVHAGQCYKNLEYLRVILSHTETHLSNISFNFLTWQLKEVTFGSRFEMLKTGDT